MSNNLILFFVFIMFVLSSIGTYTKSLRDSTAYMVYMLATSILGSYLWVVASRRLDKVADLLWFSLVWDVLMAAAFYIIPLLFFEHKMNWQSWAAVSMIVVGILWFKTSTSVG